MAVDPTGGLAQIPPPASMAQLDWVWRNEMADIWGSLEMARTAIWGLAFVGMVTLSEASYAQTGDTGFDMLRPCASVEAFLNGRSNESADDLLQQGLCLGTIAGVKFLGQPA